MNIMNVSVRNDAYGGNEQISILIC